MPRNPPAAESGRSGRAGQGIEQYHPFFYEDPILPDNLDAMDLSRRRSGFPIATGERFFTMQQFATLAPARRGAVHPSRCLPGRRLDELQEDRRAGRSLLRPSGAPQPAQPREHRGLHSTGRVHPEFRSCRNTREASTSRPRARSSGAP